MLVGKALNTSNTSEEVYLHALCERYLHKLCNYACVHEPSLFFAFPWSGRERVLFATADLATRPLLIASSTTQLRAKTAKTSGRETSFLAGEEQEDSQLVG